MKKFVFLFLLSTNLLYSQNDSEKMNLYSKKILGTWLWENSFNDFSNQKLQEPENLSYFTKWTFTDDGKLFDILGKIENGSYRFCNYQFIIGNRFTNNRIEPSLVITDTVYLGSKKNIRQKKCSRSII